MEKKIICINCPMGCSITVTYEDAKDVSGFTVTGNTCPRGEAYAISEVTDPKRTVTSTVLVKSEGAVKVPVKTKEPVPKNKIFDVMKEIHGVSIAAPVRIGDVIIEDCAGTGISIVATDNVAK